MNTDLLRAVAARWREGFIETVPGGQGEHISDRPNTVVESGTHPSGLARVLRAQRQEFACSLSGGSLLLHRICCGRNDEQYGEESETE